MKKQVFKRMSSAVLAFVMVFVMLPSFSLPTFAWTWKDDGKFEVAAYNVPILGDGAIWVDADLDAKYLFGTKITSYPDEEPFFRDGEYSPLKDFGKGDFIAYVAVDTMGIYVYAEIEDSTIFETTDTNGNTGDCFQIYFDWCTPEIVHPSPAELYEMYLLDGVGWNAASYKAQYNVNGLQYIGWLSADYNGVVTSSGGFNPHYALGPGANDAVVYAAKLIEGGWACEWFVPWRDQKQKDMIANGEQFHCGIGFMAGDDADIGDTCTPGIEENCCLKFDQRKEMGLSYWADYSMLADLVFVSSCTSESGHNYETYETVAPTCMEDGYTVKRCSICYTVYNDNYVPKLGHGYVLDAEKNVYACSRCGVECDHSQREGGMCAVCQLPIGTCGENLTWFFDENTKTLTISGTGAMYDYDYTSERSSVPWDYYRDDIVNVVIEEGITAIGAYAFYLFYKEIVDISFPNSLTHIGAFAFTGCIKLSSIELPDSLTTIGDNAFQFCHGVAEITIPASVTNISTYAFSHCAILNKVIFDDDTKLKIIGEYTFSYCKRLTEINIPDSITDIEAFAFEYCSGLEKINFSPDGKLNRIGLSAFRFCDSLVEVTIPSYISIIEAGAFRECKNLENVVFDENSKIEHISGGLFRDCRKLESVTLPKNLKSIGDGAFLDCDLKSIVIPGTVTSIGNSAFYRCVWMKNMTYCGTEEMWINNVIKEPYWNFQVSAPVQFHNYIMGFCTECMKGYNAIKLESSDALVGHTFNVTVSSVINEGVWSVAFELPIDPDVFEFVGSDTSNSIFDQFAICEFDETTNSYKFNAYNSNLTENITIGGELVTLTLRVKEGVTAGEYQLAAKTLDKHIINVDQTKVEFHTDDAKVNAFDYILGDANGDGDVTNADVLVIFRYIYNASLYPIAQLSAADVNRDGDITNADVLCIFRYIYNPELYPLG